MSEQLFDRSASVIISLAGETTGIELSGLRISFDIKKNSETTPNTATVQVYNLSEDTRNQISTVETPQLILSAGYLQAGGEEIIFVGDITNIKHEQNGPDYVSSFECDDGKNALRDARISISRVAGSSAKEVLNDLIKELEAAGISLKYKPENIPEKAYVNGFSSVGTVKASLDNVTARLGLEWSVQAKQLKIVPEGETDNLIGIKIAPDSGLIGEPKRLSFTALKKKQGLKSTAGIDPRNKKKIGWAVRSLLQPKIEPQSRVAIESKLLLNDDSIYRVESVTHSGDTHGLNWFSDIEVVTL